MMNSLIEPEPEHDESKDRVPLFGTWRNAYCAVTAALVVNILVLYACTRLLS